MSRLYDASYRIARKQESAIWAWNWKAQGFLLIDIESTGKNKTGRDFPVQISVVNSEHKVLFNSLIKPPIPIPAEVTAIHGISDEDVRLAPTFPQAYEGLRTIFNKQLVCSYNLEFDRTMIRQAVAYYQLPPPVADGFDCVMLRYGAFKGTPNQWNNGFKWWKLDDACRNEGIERDEHHKALADALAALELVETMALSKYDKAASSG